MPIDVVMSAPDRGSPPGGGSEKPVAARNTPVAPEQPSPETKPRPKVAFARRDNALPALGEEPPELPVDTDEPRAPADLVTQASGHESAESARGASPSLEQRPIATATRVAPQQSALSGFLGDGPGARRGPGGGGAGFGRGNGVVTRQFQFGGPSGAFRADVCFIPETTTSLREVRGCQPFVTFFTDQLDVPPRSFNEGFPGVTTRTEWFAIYYRGSFQVAAGDYYTFRLVSDDGALLYIDGYLVIDNDHQHPPAGKEATLPLGAGRHDLRVEYYQGPRDRIALQLFVTGSDGKQKLFGPVI
jgi:hypothetical protein